MILFLHGADTYRSRQKLKEIKAKFRREVDPQGYNLTELEGKDLSAGQIMDAIGASPFLAPKRMLVIEGLSQANFADDEKKVLLSAFEKLLNDEMILVIWEAGLNKKELASPFHKIFLASSYSLVFDAMNSQQIAGWIQAELQKEGISIDREALHFLSLSVEEDLWRAASETQKLVHYAKANKKTQLDQTEIKKLIPAGRQDDIFALVDSISQRRQKEALLRLQEQLDSGAHELEVMSMIFRQYRLLAQAKSGQQEGLDKQGIAKEYGMHPFVAGKMLSQSAQFSEEEIHNSYASLASTDLFIKSRGISANLLLTKTVAALSA